MSNSISKIWYVTWWGYGIKIEDVQDNGGRVKYSISVPFSTEVVVGPKKMAGHDLAMHFKGLLHDLGVNADVSYTVRDEHWTRKKSVDASIMAKNMLFGG